MMSLFNPAWLLSFTPDLVYSSGLPAECQYWLVVEKESRCMVVLSYCIIPGPTTPGQLYNKQPGGRYNTIIETVKPPRRQVLPGPWSWDQQEITRRAINQQFNGWHAWHFWLPAINCRRDTDWVSYDNAGSENHGKLGLAENVIPFIWRHSGWRACRQRYSWCHGSIRGPSMANQFYSMGGSDAVTKLPWTR